MNPARTFDVENERQRAHLSGFVLRQSVPFQATIGPLRKQRAAKANARLWALHSLAADVTGYSAEEMHELALIRHFGFADKECGGAMIRVPLKRSSTRDTKEFAVFMEATEAWYGTEFGVWLPCD